MPCGFFRFGYIADGKTNEKPFFSDSRLVNFFQIMSATPWVITEAEMKENDIQFSSLNPVNGFVSGDQAGPFFMKSGLPAAVLAQVWQLADFTKVIVFFIGYCFFQPNS